VTGGTCLVLALEVKHQASTNWRVAEHADPLWVDVLTRGRVFNLTPHCQRKDSIFEGENPWASPSTSSKFLATRLHAAARSAAVSAVVRR